MKKGLIIFVAILGAVILIIFIIRLLSPEDTWIKDSRGVFIKHGNPSSTSDEVKNQQDLILKAQNLFTQAKNSNKNLTDGPCLGQIDNTSVDIVHDPRNALDDKSENQCQEYLNKKTGHFIELDLNGNIFRIY